MPAIIEATTTTETIEQAQQLAERLLAARLAACVQITGPIHSVYRWQGKVCQASEFRCTIKSNKRLTSQLLDMIQAEHPYDTPEILIVDVADCAANYARWLDEQLQPTAE